MAVAEDVAVARAMVGCCQRVSEWQVWASVSHLKLWGKIP